MRGEWCYFKSYFDKETCERIINDAQIIPVQDGLIGTKDVIGVDNDIRRRKIRFIMKDDWRFSYVFDALWKTAIQANDDFFSVQISKLDFIQLAEYDESYQGEYKTHHDVFWLNNDPTYHRKLTCVIQLSDPSTYEGGNLEIVDCSIKPDAEEIRRQGSVIYFPSLLTHRANPVTKGKRYSIAAWFDGPKWR